MIEKKTAAEDQFLRDRCAKCRNVKEGCYGVSTEITFLTILLHHHRLSSCSPPLVGIVKAIEKDKKIGGKRIPTEMHFEFPFIRWFSRLCRSSRVLSLLSLPLSLFLPNDASWYLCCFELRRDISFFEISSLYTYSSEHYRRMCNFVLSNKILIANSFFEISRTRIEILKYYMTYIESRVIYK